MKAALSLLPFFFALSAVSATPASNQRRDGGWIQLNLDGTNYIPNTNSGFRSMDHTWTSADVKNYAETICVGDCQAFAYWLGENLVYRNGKTTENWSAKILEYVVTQPGSTGKIGIAQQQWRLTLFDHPITSENFGSAPDGRIVTYADAYNKGD